MLMGELIAVAIVAATIGAAVAVIATAHLHRVNQDIVTKMLEPIWTEIEAVADLVTRFNKRWAMRERRDNGAELEGEDTGEDHRAGKLRALRDRWRAARAGGRGE